MEVVVQHEQEILIKRCRKGDREAQYALYQQYARPMLNVAHRIVNDAEEAADVVQEAFVDIFAKLDTFRGEATLGAWIKRIVVNKALNALRQHKRWHPDTLGEQAEQLPEEESSSITWPTLSVEEVKSAVHALPDGYRTVLTLFLFESYSHQDIADTLGISLSTSKSQYHRARLKLRDILAQQNSFS